MSCASGLAFTIVNTFFSKLEVVNKDNVPLDKPVIVVANHNNQFIDAAVVHHILPRKGSFIVAEASMHRCIIGDVARMIGSVPVIRPQDRAVVGNGQLIEVNLDNQTLTGLKTNFTEINILTEKAKIDVKGVCSFTVAEVISDTEVRIKVPSDGDERAILESKVDLFSSETPQNFKVLPYINQKDVYQAVTDKLAGDGCIVIFPEGGSHDQSKLLPLKPGVAVMALGAMREGVEVQIVPVGINYFKPELFRSRVLVEVGKPIDVPSEIYQKYESGATRDAYQDLMEIIRQSMVDVTLNAPNYKTQNLMRVLRRFYQNGVELSADEYLGLYRRFLKGYEKWNENAEFKMLMKDVNKYLKKLKTLGLKDKSLETLEQSNSCLTFLKVLFQIMFSLLITTFLVILALPGVILNLPLWLILRRKVNKEVKKALKKSKVKIAANDVKASQKVINTIKFMLPMYLINSIVLLVILFFTYEQQNEDEQQFFLDNLFWLVPLLLFVACPFYTVFVSRVLESAIRRYSLLPARFYTVYFIYTRFAPSCLGGKTRFSPQADVRVKRRELVIRTQDLINELTADDPEWQNDPIIPEAHMNKRRRMLTKYMVDFLERKPSDRTLLSRMDDEEVAKLRDMSVQEKDAYLNEIL